MRKNSLFVIVLLIVFGSCLFCGSVKAEDSYDNTLDAEMFDYENEDESSTDLNDNDVNDESIDDVLSNTDNKSPNNLIFVEVFCGIVGLFMVFLAFKINESN